MQAAPGIASTAVFALVLAALIGGQSIRAHERHVSALPACVEEDGSGGPLPCYWDASVRGNGVGESYVVGR